MQVLITISLILVFVCCAIVESDSDCECVNSNIQHTIEVSQSGSQGDFSRVQDAIDAVPSNNNRWIIILVNPGTYIEQVQIPPDKKCVALQGNRAVDTIISFDAHGATDTSATFTSYADNIVAKNIAFVNSYGRDEKGTSQIKQAVAARVYGDKSAFYDCYFVGIQDTLWDAQGRHYFKSCYIEGAIDFIWGTAQSVYEDCEINVIQRVGRSFSPGYITAQGRQSIDDPSGFVFIRGSVYGSGMAYLGRAYGAFSRVIFHETNLGNVIVPLGWNAWMAIHQENQLMYVEASCSGAGADLSQRVEWMKKLSETEISTYYSVATFIDQDGWIAKQSLTVTSLSSYPFYFYYYSSAYSFSFSSSFSICWIYLLLISYFR